MQLLVSLHCLTGCVATCTGHFTAPTLRIQRCESIGDPSLRWTSMRAPMETPIFGKLAATVFYQHRAGEVMQFFVDVTCDMLNVGLQE